MLRILLPVDGSECALRAVQFAIDLAKASKDVEIQLLNVQEPPMHYGMTDAYIEPEVLRKFEMQAADRALEKAEQLLKGAGVMYRRHTAVGHVGRTIADEAERRGATQIVMGSQGMTAMGSLVLGSVSTKVIHLATVPVTLVK